MTHVMRGTPRRIKSVVVALALAAGLLAVPAVMSTSPAQAACTPTMSRSVSATPWAMYLDVKMNACATRVVYDKYGNSSGAQGVISFVAGLIPGWPARTVAVYFGARSVSDYFTSGNIKGCSKNFTRPITITYIDGNFSGCRTR